MKKRKNPFSADEVTWLRRTVDNHGGRVRTSNNKSIEAFFTDEESAEKFKEDVENNRDEVPSLVAMDQSSLYDEESDELIDVLVTVHGEKPPEISENSSSDWLTYALIAAAGVAAYFVYKNAQAK